MQDQRMTFGEPQQILLYVLRNEKKFVAEDFYPGAPSEALRLDAENQVNLLIDRLITGLRTDASKRLVMFEFKHALERFSQTDTEERERFCAYLERIMDITGIESSDGLLNSWLYGFDPERRE